MKTTTRRLLLAASLTFAAWMPGLAKAAPEYFAPNSVLPAPNTVDISTAATFAQYPGGVIIRNVQHHFFTQNFTPPPLGSSSNLTFGSKMDFEVSFDNGATFQLASASNNVQMQLTHTNDAGPTNFFAVEILQMDFAGPASLFRESPTLHSTGQIIVRSLGGVGGGYMISGFFDVFTEFSPDGGITWQAALGSGHLEHRNDPKSVTPVVEPTRLLPPPNGWFISPQLYFATYAQPVVLRDPRLKEFTASYSPPAPGVASTNNFNLQLDMQESTDGGATYAYQHLTAPIQVVLNSTGSGSSGWYDAEITSFNLTFPGGAMIRESPTLPSRGPTQITPLPDGTYSIGSFFDIFTELSVDGGATWGPATTGPARIQLTTPANEIAEPTPNLLPAAGRYTGPPEWFAIYVNSIIITNAQLSQFSQSQPPPLPGGSQTSSFSSALTGLISTNGGATFSNFSAQASTQVQINSRADLDTGNTRFFDTEMLSLNASGGTLPGGVMIRESPTKASLGRTSIRTVSGTDYRISSFFDVITEVSIDGGATWSPSVVFPGRLALTTNSPAPVLNIAPAAGNLSVLFWPASATNYILLSTTNLSSPNWTPVTDAVPVNAVTVSNQLPRRFFILQPQ